MSETTPELKGIATMADKDREKWDAKYSTSLGCYEPSVLLKKFVHLAPRGQALDIACGNGRNSQFLAQQGLMVDAVDISTVATRELAKRAPNVHVICQDIDRWRLPSKRYELIVNIRFLDRRLFPMILEGLRPNGVLIFQSFIDETRETYCLKPNELLQAFQSLHIVYYEEKKADVSEKFDKSVFLVATNNGATKAK